MSNIARAASRVISLFGVASGSAEENDPMGRGMHGVSPHGPNSASLDSVSHSILRLVSTDSGKYQNTKGKSFSGTLLQYAYSFISCQSVSSHWTSTYPPFLAVLPLHIRFDLGYDSTDKVVELKGKHPHWGEERSGGESYAEAAVEYEADEIGVTAEIKTRCGVIALSMDGTQIWA